MKIIVAVSGGIDSVVLLDMLARSGGHNLVVAHFDHGMRDDSAADARFVELLAAKYGLSLLVEERSCLGLVRHRREIDGMDFYLAKQISVRQN